MTEYDDGSGTGMIPLDQVDSEMPQMRDAKSMAQLKHQRSQQWTMDTRQNQNVSYQQQQEQPAHGGGSINRGGSIGGGIQPGFYGGGAAVDYEHDAPQLYDLSGGGTTQQPGRSSDFHSAQSSHVFDQHQQYQMDDAEMKPLF